MGSSWYKSQQEAVIGTHTYYTLSTVTVYSRQQRRLTDRTDGTVSELFGSLTNSRMEVY